MLVLSRKRNEKVLIDGGITVEVLAKSKGNTVRLGNLGSIGCESDAGRAETVRRMSVVEMQIPQAVAIAG